MADPPPFDVFARPRLLGAALAAASAAMLAAAFYFQHVEGLAPCPLCVAQRWAHGASLALGAAAAAGARGRLAAPLLACLGLAFAAGAGVAGYHVGVERHWFASPTCSAAVSGDTVEALRALLWETDAARCDEIPWSLAGVSMAGYNLLVSAALAAAAFVGLRRTMGGRT